MGYPGLHPTGTVRTSACYLFRLTTGLVMQDARKMVELGLNEQLGGRLSYPTLAALYGHIQSCAFESNVSSMIPEHNPALNCALLGRQLAD